MSPTTIATILALIEQLIADAPELETKLKAIFTKENPTPDDWKALRAEALGKDYADFVPASDLPAQSDDTSSHAAVTDSGTVTPAVTPPATPALDLSPAPEFAPGTVVLNH